MYHWQCVLASKASNFSSLRGIKFLANVGRVGVGMAYKILRLTTCFQPWARQKKNSLVFTSFSPRKLEIYLMSYSLFFLLSFLLHPLYSPFSGSLPTHANNVRVDDDGETGKKTTTVEVETWMGRLSSQARVCYECLNMWAAPARERKKEKLANKLLQFFISTDKLLFCFLFPFCVLLHTLSVARLSHLLLNVIPF